MNQLNTEWLQEKITKVKYCNWLYRFICFCLGKHKTKLSYEEMYVFIYGLNKKKYGESGAKQIALNYIIEVYQYLNGNKKPNGF